MKNLVKWFGIIALVAVIVFTMAACDFSGDEEGDFDPGPYTLLTADTWANGSFNLQTRAQWYKFTATANAPSQYFHWYSADPPLGSNVNVELYDIGGRLLEDLDTFYWGKIRPTVTSGTTYFIKLSAGTSSTTGTFKIAFNNSEIAPAE